MIGIFISLNIPGSFPEVHMNEVFDDAKWAAWDARIRKNPAYDWRRHSGADKSRGDKSRK